MLDQYKNEVRWKGSNAWRNNNPGNISVPTPRNKFGEIGYDNHNPKLCVFPDYDTGWKALHTPPDPGKVVVGTGIVLTILTILEEYGWVVVFVL